MKHFLVFLRSSIFSFGILYSVVVNAQNSPQMSYSAEVDFSFSDKLRNPFSAQNDYGMREQKLQRSLGLTKLALGFELLYPQESRFRVGLRPDALNREEGFDQHDSRSGIVYFQKPEAKPLDYYDLAFLYADHLEIAIGVFRWMLEPKAAFETELEFGLLVALPESFSAVRGQWQHNQTSADTVAVHDDYGVYVDAFIFQGRQDRGERELYRDETADVGPASEDKHTGLALLVGYRLQSANHFGVLLATGRNEVDLKPEDRTPVDPLATGSGTRSDYYFALFDTLNFSLAERSGVISADYRLLKEKWDSDEFRLKSRLHQSAALTASYDVFKDMSLFIGGFYGSNQFAEGLKVNGYQFDSGLAIRPKKNLKMQIQVSEEHRDQTSIDSEDGAFALDGQPTSIMRRMAFSVSYHFDRG
jgi:hypothetical protein